MNNNFELTLENWKNKSKFTSYNEAFTLARVTSVNRESYKIFLEDRELRAELTGKLLYAAESPEELPATGDWVHCAVFDDMALIHEVLPRFASIKRKTSGKKVDYQLIATNLDTALIMQSLNQDFNVNRIERYLVMVNQAGIKPVLLLSKSDLVTPDELDELTERVLKRNPDLQIITFSNVIEQGISEIWNLLVPGKTYCLLGSSGVGKTTLLNNLVGGEYDTKTIRESDGKGKHTTTSRNLINLENGAVIIDTPGMRELANFAADDGLNVTYDEISELARDCKYSDCTHTTETGCAVLDALEEGTIDPKRYENYLKLLRESRHYEMSYFEKRRKDKGFGKMVKEVMKVKKQFKNK